MPRMGQFSGATHVYGQPLSIVKPPDNNVTKGRYSREVLRYSREHNLTRAQRDALQRQINELYAILSVSREGGLG